MRFWNRWRGLRSKIIAWSFIPTAIILTMVALVGFYAYQQVTQDLTIQSSREVVRLSAGQLATELSEFSETLNAIARTSAIYENDPADQRAALAQANNRLFVFDGGVLILDNHGVVVATQPARPEIMGQDWSNREYFRQMIRVPGTVFSNVVNDGSGGVPVVVVAVPITNPRGELVGTLVGLFRVVANSISPLYGSIVRLRIGENASAYLVDHNGYVFYHTDDNQIGKILNTPTVTQVATGKADAQRTSDANGRDIVASFAPVAGTPWGLVTEQSWDVLLAPGQRYIQFLVLLLILGLVVPAVVVTIGVQRITDPIDQLIVGAKEIAGGKFGQQIYVRTGDELEQLVKQFNVMSNELKESYTALQEREERLNLVLRGTNDGIWDWNLLTNEIYVSPRWKAMLGYTDDDLIGFDDWRSIIHPDDMEQAMSKIQSQDTDPFYQMELRLRHKDGSYRWVLARGIALRDANGNPYRVAGSHTDITERKKADEAIRQSEKRFSQVFHASPIPITITTLGDGRYIEVNNAWLKLFGYARDEVIGKSSLQLNIWANPQQRAGMIQQLASSGTLREFEHHAQTKTGEARDVLVSAEVIELNNERYNLSFVYDITELKETQQNLERRVAERTHELATLNTIAESVSRSLDLHQVLNIALDKAIEAMQMQVGTAYYLQYDDESNADKYLVLATSRGLSEAFLQRIGSRPLEGTAIQLAAMNQRPIIWLIDDYPELSAQQALKAEGVVQVINVPLIAKDKLLGAFNLGTRHTRSITPEELSLLASIGHQIAVAVENARLYDQAERSAALAERTRLARELHDSVTQSLYSVTLYAEAAAILLESGNQVDAAKHLRELRDTAQEALREMRLLIFELRPLALEKSGLAAALQARLDAVETRGGIKAELHVEGEEKLSLNLQQELYHIAQEALNNIIKHAHAHRVQVNLKFSKDCIRLEICDDGVGFDPGKLHRGGLGLSGMKERAQKIGAQLGIESQVGKGTTIHVVMQTR